MCYIDSMDDYINSLIDGAINQLADDMIMSFKLKKTRKSYMKISLCSSKIPKMAPSTFSKPLMENMAALKPDVTSQLATLIGFRVKKIGRR